MLPGEVPEMVDAKKDEISLGKDTHIAYPLTGPLQVFVSMLKPAHKIRGPERFRV